MIVQTEIIVVDNVNGVQMIPIVQLPNLFVLA